MRFITIILASTLLFTACFKKSNDTDVILLDFDHLKTIDILIPNIVYESNAYSGVYATYADSTSPYSYTVKSNLKLLNRNTNKKSFKLSAQIKRNLSSDIGTIALQIMDKSGQQIFAESIYISEANFTKENEWTKIEGTINLPDDTRISDPESTIKIFLFSTKNRIWMDDLEILVK